MFHLNGLMQVTATITERFKWSRSEDAQSVSAADKRPDFNRADVFDGVTDHAEDPSATQPHESRSWHDSSLSCPSCSRSHVSRSVRKGFQERLLSVIYIYPFKCGHCGHRFKLLQWGVRYRRVRR
jgi:hypothetical protein